MKQKLVTYAAFIALALLFQQGLSYGYRNPLATDDQLYAEFLAQYLVTDPAVVAAAQGAPQKLLNSVEMITGPVSTEQIKYIENGLAEMDMYQVLSVVASDPNYPKLIAKCVGPHSWFGMDVPGSRSGFDNPDTTYWQGPIDPKASYVIHGKRHKMPPIDENYSLWDARMATVANLSGADLVVDPDGTFTITIDSSPANGRINHLQASAAVTSVYIRNTINDWAHQANNTLTIERVDGPSLPPPKNFDDMVSQIVPIVKQSGVANFLYTRAFAQPVNTLPPLQRGGGAGGTLATQMGEYSAWAIADDEALVVTVKTGGAKYISCPVYDYWQITTDYVNHTMSLNNAQAKPNKNGTYTFVISVKDPGVYNWVDTVGMNEGLLNLRWQLLPPEVPKKGDVAATMKLVKLADLRSVLPKGTKYVTAKQRAKQLKERVAGFDRKFAEQIKRSNN